MPERIEIMSTDERTNDRVLVDVWDWQTRVLHWTNMALVLALMVLILGAHAMSYLGVNDDTTDVVAKIHAYVGYVFICTFALRIIWAFVGNRYARWSDIIPFTGEKRKAIGQNIKWYLSLFRGSGAESTGHDPLASVFYIALFIVFLSQSVTGFLLSGTEFEIFPATLVVGGMSHHASHVLAHNLREVHEFGFWFIVFFLCAHLAGLIVHEVKDKNGLFSSMIHGRKYISGNR